MALPPENATTDKPRRKRWLSPLDIVALIIFLSILANFVNWGPRSSDRARTKTATAQIGAFSTALDMFKAENGFYPAGTNGLNDLVVRPTDASTNWHQYLDKVPSDMWGHPYIYVFPGKHNTNSYDLSSAGPDGIPGTKDDIVNRQ